jgi:hypothetical protein
MGVLMFRFWAGATAGVCVCSFVISGVSAEGIGSTIAPYTGSKSSSAIVIADTNLSSRNGPASLWDQASEMGLTKSGDLVVSTPSLAFIDFASTSPYGAEWSPMNGVTNATSPVAPRLSDYRTAIDTYFGAFESLSTRGMNVSRSGGGFAAPMGGTSTMR